MNELRVGENEQRRKKTYGALQWNVINALIIHTTFGLQCAIIFIHTILTTTTK